MSRNLNMTFAFNLHCAEKKARHFPDFLKSRNVVFLKGINLCFLLKK